MMSRGPGAIQRAIAETFKSHPTEVFTHADLAAIAYPGIDQIERKHLVAVGRAARQVCLKDPWIGWSWHARSYRNRDSSGCRTSGYAGTIVHFFNACDAPSMRRALSRSYTDSDIEARVRDNIRQRDEGTPRS